MCIPIIVITFYDSRSVLLTFQVCTKKKFCFLRIAFYQVLRNIIWKYVFIIFVQFFKIYVTKARYIAHKLIQTNAKFSTIC